MKVGDLVRHKRTGKLYLVMDVDRRHVKLSGFASNQVHDIDEVEMVSETR